jgi:nucleotide-binding universal stress UspA family protein
MRRILVGYDGSELAGHALDRACELAKLYGCGVTVLSAAADRLLREDGVLTPALDEAGGQHVAEEGAQRARRQGVTDVRTRTSVEAPDDALVITSEEEGCNLIVVGHRGLSPLQELILGSTAKSIVDRAPCSVMVVRRPC